MDKTLLYMLEINHTYCYLDIDLSRRLGFLIFQYGGKHLRSHKLQPIREALAASLTGLLPKIQEALEGVEIDHDGNLSHKEIVCLNSICSQPSMYRNDDSTILECPVCKSHFFRSDAIKHNETQLPSLQHEKFNFVTLT